MKGLDKACKDNGVLFLNEIGLDPGIDHMSCQQVRHDFLKNVKFRLSTRFSMPMVMSERWKVFVEDWLHLKVTPTHGATNSHGTQGTSFSLV